MPQPGQKIADTWTLEEQVGKGAFGEVWRAHDPEGNKAAVKFLHPSLLIGEKGFEMMQRFEREAVILEDKLNSSYIMQVYGHGREDNVLYLVAEFLEGMTLKDVHEHDPRLLEGKAFAPNVQDYTLFRDIARALAHAHNRDIVHRDLKPENIMITPDGVPKVYDYGLGKDLIARRSLIKERELFERHSLTGEGAILGTPMYMAPEQAKSVKAEIGKPSDVYGLGGIIYMSLTGKAPFTAGSLLALLTEKMTSPAPDVRTLNPKVPDELAEKVNDMLAMDTSRRPSARQVEYFMDGCISQLEQQNERNWGVIAGVAAGIVGITLGGVAIAVSAFRTEKPPIVIPVDPIPVPVDPIPDTPTTKPVEVSKKIPLKFILNKNSPVDVYYAVQNENGRYELGDKVDFPLQTENRSVKAELEKGKYLFQFGSAMVPVTLTEETRVRVDLDEDLDGLVQLPRTKEGDKLFYFYPVPMTLLEDLRMNSPLARGDPEELYKYVAMDGTNRLFHVQGRDIVPDTEYFPDALFGRQATIEDLKGVPLMGKNPHAMTNNFITDIPTSLERRRAKSPITVLQGLSEEYIIVLPNPAQLRRIFDPFDDGTEETINLQRPMKKIIADYIKNPPELNIMGVQPAAYVICEVGYDIARYRNNAGEVIQGIRYNPGNEYAVQETRVVKTAGQTSHWPVAGIGPKGFNLHAVGIGEKGTYEGHALTYIVVMRREDFFSD